MRVWTGTREQWNNESTVMMQWDAVIRDGSPVVMLTGPPWQHPVDGLLVVWDDREGLS